MSNGNNGQVCAYDWFNHPPPATCITPRNLKPYVSNGVENQWLSDYLPVPEIIKDLGEPEAPGSSKAFGGGVKDWPNSISTFIF